MGENLRIFGELYYRPARALSGVLDRGRFAFAAVAAALVYFLLSHDLGQGAGGGPLLSFDFSAPMMGLVPMAAVFVPVAVVIVTWWDALGGAGVILRRDYMPLLVCSLMSWTAAYLPFGLVMLAAPDVPSVVPLVLLVASNVYFLVLTVLSVRTVMGAGAGHATVAVMAASVAVGIAIAASTVVSGLLYYLASPMVLYFGYLLFQQDLRLLSGGLSSRQSLRRHLEALTLNPRDADAHYQLGLIYQQRRHYSEAIPRFERSIEIDSSDPDPHHQLGRIFLEQKRFQDARRCFAAAVALNDKHASSEVLRDLGAADLELGETELALAELEKYVDRRNYDPEGLYLLGRALKKLGRNQEARDALERCVEAVQTLPSHRRRQTARWKGAAKSELRGL